VSEEQEQKMEELFNEMDLDGHFEGKEDKEAEQVLQTTTESLKSGELIQEAIRVYELEQKDWETHQKIGGAKPARNPFVIQRRLENEEPYKVVFEVIRSIRTSHLNDALLTLPFSQVLTLLRIISQWIDKRLESSVICRVLFFLLQVHHREIVSSGDRIILDHISTELVKYLKIQNNLIGQNVAGLRIIGQQEREVNFFGEVEEPKRGIKRLVVS
jgi:U3 small nucleolar RNA-associated protein 12